MANSASSVGCLSAFFVAVTIFSLPVGSAKMRRFSQYDHSELRPNSTHTVRVPLLNDSVLPCDFAANTSGERHPDRVEWWYKGYGQTFIGSFDLHRHVALTNWTRGGAYEVLANGTLAIRRARRELVERYHCVVLSSNGTVPLLFHVLLFRLDFSSWYALEPGSLFFGSCIAAVVFCAASFLLNIIWIVSRNTVLWWIRRTGKQNNAEEEAD